MDDKHADDEHRSEKNRLLSLTSLSHVGERYRDGGHGYRIKTEEEASKKADTYGRDASARDGFLKALRRHVISPLRFVGSRPRVVAAESAMTRIRVRHRPRSPAETTRHAQQR